MEVLSRPVVVVLNEADVPVFADQMLTALQTTWGGPGKVPPRLFLDACEALSRAVRAGGGRASSAAVPLPGLPAEPALTVAEAAEQAGTSGSYVRRCARGREFEAEHYRGAWAIDSLSFASWLAQRDRERVRAREAA